MIWRGRVLWPRYVHPYTRLKKSRIPHTHTHTQLKKSGISHTHTHTHTQSMQGSRQNRNKFGQHLRGRVYLPSLITIYKNNSIFCVHISKYQFYPLKYNYLLNFLKLTVTFTNFFIKSSISATLFFFSIYQLLFSNLFWYISLYF